MRPHLSNDGVEHAIATLAARQYGVVTREQLVSAGLGPRAINHRLSAGRLHRLHASVYAVGHVAPRNEMRWLAAVLACGPGAVLSHRSAATLWLIRKGEGWRADVTIAPAGRRKHPGITIHRSRLAPQDVTVHAGIPITTPTRTVFDRYELPSPLTRQAVRGQHVDFFWPDHHLVAETDGWEGHRTKTAFQTDRTTSNQFQLAGYTILRFTYDDICDRPARVARQLRAALNV
jgi:hypothetical protein